MAIKQVDDLTDDERRQVICDQVVTSINDLDNFFLEQDVVVTELELSPEHINDCGFKKIILKVMR